MERNYEEFLKDLEEKIEFYNLMSMLFMKDPTAEFCNILMEMLNEDYFPLAESSPEIASLHTELRKNLTGKTSAEFAKLLIKEYYDLFFDPHGIKASPWQSSYTNRDNLLYQAPDYETKAFYRRYQYRVAYDRLPGDHIAIELDFLKRLSEKEKEVLDADKLNENTVVFQDNLVFVDKYILSWISSFIDSLRVSKSTFYLLFASMIKAAGVLDKTNIHQLIGKEVED